MRDGKGVAHLPLTHGGKLPFPDVIELRVEICGKQIEGLVCERESLASLVDPALAEED